MLDGNAEDVSFMTGSSKSRACRFHLDPHPFTDKRERVVTDQRAGKQASFTQTLKPIADTNHRAARFGELNDALHHWREPSYRPAAQIVTIGETTREHDRFHAFEVAVFMP